MQLSHVTTPGWYRIWPTFLTDDFGTEIHVRPPYIEESQALAEIEIDANSFDRLLQLEIDAECDQS